MSESNEAGPENVKQSAKLYSDAPMRVAEWLLQEVFVAPSGLSSLLVHQDQWYEFAGGRWMPRAEKAIKGLLWKATKDLKFLKKEQGPSAGWSERNYNPTVARILDVYAAMEALCTAAQVKAPFWRADAQEAPDPETVVAFRDVLVNPVTGELWERDDEWFDYVCVPTDYDAEAKCPTWERCLEQWSMGSKEWQTLLQRWMGYCLLNHRRYAKWMLLYGQSRAGKGTIASVLTELMGIEATVSLSLDQLGGRFGLEGADKARLLHLTEANKQNDYDASRVVGVAKRILGQDRHVVDKKGVAATQNVLIPAAIMVQANEIPKLPDKSRGLSSKMLLLPFEWSARSLPQGEDPNLLGKLRKELAGIAAWALRGAKGVLEAQDGTERFPEVREAQEAIQAFMEESNPMDAFLEAAFVQSTGFVDADTLWAMWVGWCKKQERKPEHTRQSIRKVVKEGSSWQLEMHRLSQEPRSRGLRGLSLRRDAVL